MDCKVAKKLLSEYIDGYCDAHNVKMLKQHINICSSCKEEYDLMCKYKKSLAGLASLKAPEHFLENVRSRIERGSAISRTFKMLFFPLHYKIPVHATAFICMLFVIIYIFYPGMISEKGAVIDVNSIAVSENGKTKSKRDEKIKRAPVLKMEAGKESKSRLMPKKNKKQVAAVKPASITESAKFLVTLLVYNSEKIALNTDSIMGGESMGTRGMMVSSSSFKSKSAPSMKKRITGSEERKESLDETAAELSDDAEKPESSKDTSRIMKDDILTETVEVDKIKEKEIAADSPKVYTDPELIRIAKIVELFKGKIIKTEYINNSSKVKYIIIDIPKEKFNIFLDKLNDIREIKKPFPEIRENTPLSVRLKLDSID